MVKRLIGFILCITLVASLSISPAFAATKTTTANATLSNTKIRFNKQELLLKDSEKKLLQPILYNENIYVPLRAFSDEVGLKVFYDSKSNNILIKSQKVVTDLDAGLLEQFKTFEGAVTIGKYNGFEQCKVDRNMLPSEMKNFKYLFIDGIDSNSMRDITLSLLTINSINEKFDYDESTGCLYGTAGAFRLVALLDVNGDILGYTVICIKDDIKDKKSNKTENIKVTINNSLNIFLDGNKFQARDAKNKQLYPITFNNNTYVPLRAITDALGMNLENDNTSFSLVVKSNFNDAKKAIDNFTNSFISFDGAITSKRVKGEGTVINIDRNKLPQSMKNFTKISTMGIENNPQKYLASNFLRRMTSNIGISIYNNQEGYKSGNTSPYEIVTLYDNTENILGYSIVTVYSNVDTSPVNITVSPTDATPKIPLGYESFSGGITISGNVPREYNIRVDRNVLPEAMRSFKKISVYSTDDISSSSISINLKETEKHHYGVQNYEDRGFGLLNFHEGFSNKYNVVILLNDSNKIIGYSVIQVLNE